MYALIRLFYNLSSLRQKTYIRCYLMIREFPPRNTSHYMEEVEQICTRIAILDRGRCVASGTKEELKAMIKTGEKIHLEAWELRPEQLEEIRRLRHVYQVDYREGMLEIRCSGGKHNLVHILDYMTQQEIGFGRVYAELPTLNDVFLEITGKELRDSAE